MIQNKELIETVRRYNELMSRFNKAEDFFEKYPNYAKSNPKECKELEKKLENICNEIVELDWINKYKSEFTKDDRCIITLKIPTQAKLF